MIANLYWKTCFSLAIILSIILFILFILKRFKKYSITGENLSIEETLIIDGRRRIIVIKYKDNRYVMLVGGNNDLIIQQENAI
ncbi:MAG: hypothetical protein HRK26_01200 [Rickettsiaceae bacterium H1]|nr:hypothetical protein [Rickettsiaceae bacterium H1]